MATCVKCETFWTTAGMTHCPVCGTAVPGAAPEIEPSRELVQAAASGKSTNGTARIEGPRDPQKPKTRPLPPPDPGPGPLPTPPVMHKEEELKVTLFPKAEKPEPDPKPEKPVQDSMGDPLSVDPVPLPVDASVVLPKPKDQSKPLPKPARPLNGPIILGALAVITAVLLPLTLVFESHRIIGIIGFCLSGFFLPFAPIAWIAGLSAEKRRREQNLSPEQRVVIGRFLGQVGTVLLVAEATIVLILIAGLRLSGSFPSTFWKGPQAF